MDGGECIPVCKASGFRCSGIDTSNFSYCIRTGTFCFVQKDDLVVQTAFLQNYDGYSSLSTIMNFNDRRIHQVLSILV